MAKYVFKNKAELDAWIKKIGITEYVGRGTEGVCYLGNDGYAYKICDDTCTDEFMDEAGIVLDKDINLDSYLFPIDIYVIDGKVMGYKTKYIKGDRFLNFNDKKKDINTDNLEKAYLKLIKDTLLLSEKHVHIYDLPGNLMYDNKSFYAIDTSYYTYVDWPIEKVVMKNLSSVLYALNSELLFMKFYMDNDSYNKLKVKLQEIEGMHKKIQKSVKNKYKTKRI